MTKDDEKMQFGEKSNDYENNARSRADEGKKGEGAKKSSPIKRAISYFKSKLSEKGEREVRLRLERRFPISALSWCFPAVTRPKTGVRATR